MLKEKLYQNLVREFKEYDRFPDKLVNPYKIDERFRNQIAINPWELWYGNLNAEILLIGQDFSDKEYFIKNLDSNWQKEIDSPTNKTLQILFKNLGYEIELPEYGKINKTLPLFFTNAVLGIKLGENKGMSEPVKYSWYSETAKLFTKELINIIQPNIIITLGQHAYQMMCRAYDAKAESPFKNIQIEQKTNEQFQWFAVYHCSPSSLSRNRGLKEQQNDWIKIKKLIKK